MEYERCSVKTITLLEEIKEDLNKQKDINDHESEDLILSRWQYSSN